MSVSHDPDLEKEMGINIYNDDDFKGITAFVKHSWIKKVLFVMGLVAVGVPIFEVFFYSLAPSIQRPIHLFFMYSIVFIMYPSNIIKNGKIESLANIFLIILTLAVSIWAWLRWVPLLIDPSAEFYEVILMFVLIFLTFEATRRTIGSAMGIISLIFLIYAFIGPYMPRFFAHAGFSPYELVTHIGIGTEGMLGDLLAIGCTQIVFFMMFAAFLKISDATTLFMDLSKAIAGHRIGGPAKVAVVSSGFMAMLSGSASGNTATTGSVTIPLMVSMGFKKRMAAAIEATSSTAGQFMPPIMGAAAFVIAEYTGNTYWAVCIAAFLPSFLYYALMFFTVDIRSKKAGMSGLSKDELPSLKNSVIEALPMILPVGTLVILLSMQFSIQYGILMSLVVLVISLIPFRKRRMTPTRILKAIALTSKILIPITVSCASAGLIVGVMSLTGFGERLAYGIQAIANGNLFIGLSVTAFICVILGMGLPTLAAYVVLASLGVPALVHLGAPLLAAHLFVFYFAILSTLTPPVALSAYVAAGIAGANPMKTAFTAVQIAPFIYALPFFFVFFPGLLLNAPLLTVVKDIFVFVLFMLPFIVLSGRYWLTRLNIIEMFLFALAPLSFFVFRDHYMVSMVVFNGLATIIHASRNIKNKKEVFK